MDKIIKNYYLLSGSKLIHHKFGRTNGKEQLVDCWFDTNPKGGTWEEQHRCLSLNDFKSITTPEQV